jgi:hypothetical protein
MKTDSPIKAWLCDAAAEFVEGLADGFIIVSGGAQAAQITSAQVRGLTLEELGISMLLAGCWYVAAFVKKNKPPFGQTSTPATPSSS